MDKVKQNSYNSLPSHCIVSILNAREGSPEGYVPVDQILRHSSITQQRYKVEDIEKVVAEDKKQRFVLKKDNGKLFIKACQGHSVPLTKAEHTSITEPIYDTVVHGTYLNVWPSILEQGLSRCKRQHIHFAKGTPKDKSVISGLRSNVEVYIYIDLKKALDDGIKFFESENGVILTEGKDGFLNRKYFLKVIKVDTGEKLYP
ncbi:RNA 2'-phosphotransferase, tpt1 / kptA family domain-containing protein [Phthorimaea operculella]|nr:RNA 2'-phosphotransferase, tpt1 / kptA family domain-containing protein [Phthorimaea operculella]